MGEKVPINIRQFEHGTQGAHKIVGVVQREIHESVGTFPLWVMCAAEPIQSRKFRWIVFLGKRWPISKEAFPPKGDCLMLGSHVELPKVIR